MTEVFLTLQPLKMFHFTFPQLWAFFEGSKSFFLNQKLTIFFSLSMGNLLLYGIFLACSVYVFVKAIYVFWKVPSIRENLFLALIWMELNIKRTGSYTPQLGNLKTISEREVLLIPPNVCRRGSTGEGKIMTENIWTQLNTLSCPAFIGGKWNSF